MTMMHKEHPLFSQDPTVLQIMIFYDDMEVVNPLGSYTKKTTHKLGDFNVQCKIYTIKYYLSTLLHTHKHITGASLIADNVGIELKPFMEELAKLVYFVPDRK